MDDWTFIFGVNCPFKSHSHPCGSVRVQLGRRVSLSYTIIWAVTKVIKSWGESEVLWQSMIHFNVSRKCQPACDATRKVRRCSKLLEFTLWKLKIWLPNAVWDISQVVDIVIAAYVAENVQYNFYHLLILATCLFQSFAPHSTFQNWICYPTQWKESIYKDCIINFLCNQCRETRIHDEKEMAAKNCSALWATQAAAMPNNDVMVKENWVTTCVFSAVFRLWSLIALCM